MAAPSFDAVAPVYDHLARLVFGTSIEQAQTHFLDAIPAEAHVLIIGGGTGWIIGKLLHDRHLKRIDYVEASIRMIRLAQRNYDVINKQPHARPNPQVNFIHGTEKDLPQDTRYDVVITFFVLDMQSDDTLQAMMDTLYARLKAPGIWLFADFKINKKRRWHRLLVSAMFLFFRLICHLQHSKLPDYDRAFAQLKLIRRHEKFFYGKLIHSAVYSKV